jgi:sugar phosphate isomerase/epimerase
LRVGLFTDAFPGLSLEGVLEWLAAELPSVEEVEIATGGYSAAPHCDRRRVLEDDAARSAWLDTIESRGFRLAALNVSGNPLSSPEDDLALRETIALAGLLGVDRIVCMSGGRPELSGGAWFPGIEEAVERYWVDRVLPYWTEIAQVAAEQPTLRLCFELEPGAAAFNVSTVERLLALAPTLAVNLDPSHFFWQAIDPLAAVRHLTGRIGFAHGKDTVLAAERVALDGTLDRAAWWYATVGHGRGLEWWRAFAQGLRAAGYDGVISIEYEDPRVAADVSVVEAAGVLAQAIVERVAR